jgi:hypothetical protein
VTTVWDETMTETVRRLEAGGMSFEEAAAALNLTPPALQELLDEEALEEQVAEEA